MTRATKPIAALVLAALVAACAAPTTVVEQNPRKIELRWPNGTGDFNEAMLAARDHCAEYGERPALGSMFVDRDVSLATIRCR